MSAYRITQIIVYLISFVVSMYALGSVRFELFCNIRQVQKVRILLLILAMALAYLVGQFLLILMPLA